jgi:hypothetical protein
MDSFWVVFSGVKENAMLIGLYALLDYVMPMISGPITAAFPQGGALIGGAMNGIDFIAKQVMFHFFSRTQIKQLLG